jgi:hypothetical protein
MSTGHRAARGALARFLARLTKAKKDARQIERPRRVEGRWLRFWRWLAPFLVPALFVASLVHGMERLEILPLDAPARLIVSNFAANDALDAAQPKAGQDDDFAILKIDHDTFEAPPYNGTSPLNRCALQKDVESLLALRTLRVLGIDFDLSPVKDTQQQGCTERLLDSLQAFVRKGPDHQVALILPVDLQDRRTQTAWLREVHERGLLLADPDLSMQVGMVHQHVDDEKRCPGLGVAMSGTAKRPERTDRQTNCLHAEGDGTRPEAEARNIDFLRLARLKHYFDASKGLSAQIEQWQKDGEKIARVILGPGYDRADEFMTPLGDLNGVEIHAAIALEPDMKRKAALDFGIDVLLGIAFGRLFHVFWHRYFNQRLSWHGSRASPRTAYLWLVAMAAASVAALYMLGWVSMFFYVHWSTWMSPTPMAIGMLLDALVLGSVHTVVEHEHEAREHGHDAAPPGWRGLLARVPALVWWAVVLFAFGDIVHASLPH